MARGWESKSVEEQQAAMAERGKTVRRPVSPAQQMQNRKREGLELSRRRLETQLEAASHARHREMLLEAITEIDRQLACFDGITESRGT
jgi:hypothetical protein